MSLEALLQLNFDSSRAREACDAVTKRSGVVQIEGLAAAAKGWMLANIFTQTKRTMLVVTYNHEQAERIAEDLPLYGIPPGRVLFYPSSDSLIYEEGPPVFSVIGERLGALHALLAGEPVIVIAPINAALRRTMPRATLMRSYAEVKVGDEIDLDRLVELLVSLGYEHTDVVDRHGEFSRRGGIVDVYASNTDCPLRIDLFGDQIDSIRHFDSATQRSIDRVDSALILPTREVLLDQDNAPKAAQRIGKELAAQMSGLGEAEDPEATERVKARVEDAVTSLENLAYFDDIEFYLPYLYAEEYSIFDYLPEDAIVVLDEPMQIKSHWEQQEASMLETLINRAGRGLLLASQKRQHVAFEPAIRHALSAMQGVLFSLLPRSVAWARSDVGVQIESAPTESFAGRMDSLAEQIKTWRSHDLTVVVASAQDKRMLEILAEFGVAAAHLEESLNPAPGVYVAHAPLRSGFKLHDAGLMVVTDSEIFGEQRLHRPRKAGHEGVPISSVLDLKEGDFVVHINHGIGYYRGITRLNAQGVEREYLLLEYAGNDRLYVPSDQIDRVQRYIGGEATPPTVHRLGGSDWIRTTKRVKKAVREMAKELVELYAWRQALGGHAYSVDTPWQQEMESAFPYVETPDQLHAIQDVKRDLEDYKPMDRLICGDVGYGKTEVAIRAAFKVVSEGRQAAILCPTTVLAQQHFNTFTERLAAFPISIQMLSRFRTRKEQLETVEGLKYGTVDIVIGTHRMLSKDVEFRDLGLLVVDEEQRFGVRHKEKIKQLRKTVDALTMTATPIPRTLHMSLSGIRDMSIIEDPPEGRMPIKTFIKEAQSDTVRSAIMRELDRGGQVFFVHNKVENIGHVADQIQKLVPYARVDAAHGQMPESELERIMMEFYEHKFDVLVCTTIIESGLDIPNANTIIINESDKLGLAQLYQLRGRVGRSDRQAYAYLLYRPDKVLSEVAEKRLDAIREFTELGSGYRVALRDLEIRGAGNLLGAEQSGQMAAVGFDMYCQLLSQAVSELKGEEVEQVELPTVDLPVDAFIPQSYMPTDAHRILFYKKMAAVRDEAAAQAVQDELEDRFGDPPRPVWNMLAIIRLRIRCAELGISNISASQNQVQVYLNEGTRLSDEARLELRRAHRKHRFEYDRMIINPSGARVISEVEDMVEILAAALRRSGNRLEVGPR